MKEETLVKVSGELETCGKALLKLAEALRAKEETLAPEPQKNEPVLPNLPWKKCGRWRRIRPVRDSRMRSEG